jgi:hypothetical protein
MIVRAVLIAITSLAVAGPLSAKLPPPTPAQQAAEADRRAREEAQLQAEKVALERAQDAIAARYQRERGGRPSVEPAGHVSDTNMPKTARELPRSAGPHGGSQQSAEAHSAPAK